MTCHVAVSLRRHQPGPSHLLQWHKWGYRIFEGVEDFILLIFTAESIFAVFFSVFSSLKQKGVEMPSCFGVFLCFVMDALRIGGAPWDTER